MTNALIVVDIQRDFCEKGRLPVAGGKDLARRTFEMVNKARQQGHTYNYIVATKDFHKREGDNDGHFGDPPDYVNSWPKHCTSDTSGANFMYPLTSQLFHDVFKKGRGVAAYSGFEGVGGVSKFTLHEFLRGQGVTEVIICGIAFDYCVKATALDAAKLGYKTSVWKDYTVSVNPANDAEVEMVLRSRKIEVI